MKERRGKQNNSLQFSISRMKIEAKQRGVKEQKAASGTDFFSFFFFTRWSVERVRGTWANHEKK